MIVEKAIYFLMTLSSLISTKVTFRISSGLTDLLTVDIASQSSILGWELPAAYVKTLFHDIQEMF